MVAARLKVPLLEDKLEEHQSWIFDTVAKKTLVQRLFTLMTGSVVTSEIGAKGSSKRGAAKQKAKNRQQESQIGSQGRNGQPCAGGTAASFAGGRVEKRGGVSCEHEERREKQAVD